MQFFTPEKDSDVRREEDGSSSHLPYALIIGDSISQGYTDPVRELLKGCWNVERPKANCGDTERGLESIDEWLGNRDWDVIHFNWGLHDICHRHPDSKVYGNRDKVKGEIAVGPDEYRVNLEKLVVRMKESGKRLIWAATTFVPPDEVGRHQGDEITYNQIASDIMEAHGVEINDLHSLTAEFSPSLFTQPGDVHYTAEGLGIIARQVAEIISSSIPV